MALLPLPDIFYDGNFDFPQEIEGGPLFSTDEVTRSMSITRLYVVKASAYVPLPQGTPDRQYKNAYLIEETPTQRRGPLMYFTRLYWELPVPRTEQRMVSFTILGQSSISKSSVTGQVIGWNQYGIASPNTRNVVGFSDYSYATNPNAFAKPAITRNTYKGAPVDYMGFVYDYIGVVQVNADLSEPRWRLAGSTFFALMPGIWYQEVNITRWRGGIWQMEVVRVLPYTI